MSHLVSPVESSYDYRAGAPFGYSHVEEDTGAGEMPRQDAPSHPSIAAQQAGQQWQYGPDMAYTYPHEYQGLRGAQGDAVEQPADDSSLEKSNGLRTTETDAWAAQGGGGEPLVRPAPWGLHWHAPSMMAGLFLFGVGSCLGHHFYYRSLQGTHVKSDTDQEWAIRIGTGLSFLAKASLAAAVGVAYNQRLWWTLRTKSLTLIDGLFSWTSDPTIFFHYEVLWRAKVLALLAAAVWLIPLMATVAPATLSVRLAQVPGTANAVVPYLNWDDESPYAVYGGAGFLTAQTTIPVYRLLAATSTSGSVQAMNPPFPNSSYPLRFYGPSLRCEYLNATAWEEHRGIFDQMMHQPAELGLYNATVPSSLSDGSLADSIFINIGGVGTTAHNMTCALWNTSYAATVSFTNGGQAISGLSLDHVARKRIEVGKIATDYAKGEAAYNGFFAALQNVLVTYVGMGASGNLFNPEAFLLQTSVATCPEMVAALNQSSDYVGGGGDAGMCRSGSFARAVEDLSHNFTLGLMSSPALSGNTTATLRVVTPRNVYAYSRRNLVVAYSLGVGVTVACLAVGVLSLHANGFSAKASFSSVLFTTRNPVLDGLAAGHCLPAQPLGREMGKTRLQYGLLRDPAAMATGVEHAAFGMEGHVAFLRKGHPCA